MQTSTAIIDYGMGNLGSVRRAFEECGSHAIITSDPDDIFKASHIVLPGVGSFSDGMRNLITGKWISNISSAVVDHSIPLLGICLGMQLLADIGHENGKSKGIGLIPGEVIPLRSKKIDERIPHVGWNEVEIISESTLFDGIPTNSDFYFVHSYHFKTKDETYVKGLTPYCGGVSSVIEKGLVAGVQFHPEKSAHFGFQLIHNFLNTF